MRIIDTSRPVNLVNEDGEEDHTFLLAYRKQKRGFSWALGLRGPLPSSRIDRRPYGHIWVIFAAALSSIASFSVFAAGKDDPWLVVVPYLFSLATVSAVLSVLAVRQNLFNWDHHIAALNFASAIDAAFYHRELVWSETGVFTRKPYAHRLAIDLARQAREGRIDEDTTIAWASWEWKPRADAPKEDEIRGILKISDITVDADNPDSLTMKGSILVGDGYAPTDVEPEQVRLSLW